jgi:hypothetical protein
MRDKLRALITQLRLHGMAEALDAEIERAERESRHPSCCSGCSARRPRPAANAAWRIVWDRRVCHGAGHSTAFRSIGSPA